MTNKPKTIEEVNKNFEKERKRKMGGMAWDYDDIFAFFQSQYTELFKEFMKREPRYGLFLPSNQQELGSYKREQEIRSRAKQGGMEL